jgi:hypothetical protein
MLTTMTESEWAIVCGRRARGAATRAGTTASFFKRCSILWSTTSRGACFHAGSATGTVCGNGSGD